MLKLSLPHNVCCGSAWPRLFVVVSLLVPLLIVSETTACSAAMLSPQASGSYRLDRQHASLTFRVNHLGYSYYTGRFNIIDATLEFNAKVPTQSILKATVTPASVDVDNAKLQTELQSADYFNVHDFPEIMFVSRKILRTGESTGVVEGDLTFRGITKPLALNVTFNNGGINPYTSKYTLGFSASANLDRSDWGMEILVPHIADNVTLQFEGEFQKVDDEPPHDRERENEDSDAAEEEMRNERALRQ